MLQLRTQRRFLPWALDYMNARIPWKASIIISKCLIPLDKILNEDHYYLLDSALEGGDGR